MDFLLLVFAYVLPILAFLFAVAFLTPSWHWVVGFIVPISIGLGCAWVQHQLAIQAPGYKEGPGGGLIIPFIEAFIWAWVIAVAICLYCLHWWHSRN